MVRAASIYVEAKLKADKFRQGLGIMRSEMDKTASKGKDFSSMLGGVSGTLGTIGSGLAAVGLGVGATFTGLVTSSSTFKSKWAEVNAQFRDTSEVLGKRMKPTIKFLGDGLIGILKTMKDPKFFATSPIAAFQSVLQKGFKSDFLDRVQKTTDDLKWLYNFYTGGKTTDETKKDPTPISHPLKPPQDKDIPAYSIGVDGFEIKENCKKPESSLYTSNVSEMKVYKLVVNGFDITDRFTGPI